MSQTAFLHDLKGMVSSLGVRSLIARHVAHFIQLHRKYRWLGLYEVTPTEIGMIAATGVTPPAFPRFPVTEGLCGSVVATRSLVNVGNVQEDPRWLTTFGNTRSEIIVPVFAPEFDRPIGLIDVESDTLNAFSDDDEQFLTACAPHVLPLFL